MLRHLHASIDYETYIEGPETYVNKIHTDSWQIHRHPPESQTGLMDMVWSPTGLIKCCCSSRQRHVTSRPWPTAADAAPHVSKLTDIIRLWWLLPPSHWLLLLRCHSNMYSTSSTSFVLFHIHFYILDINSDSQLHIYQNSTLTQVVMTTITV